MATVKSLIDFYNNQNALAVQATGQTAQNQTSANIAGAQIGADQKRQQQELQLERFRQLMANQRQARDLSSQEGIALATRTAAAAQSELGRNFEGTQNEQTRQFNVELAKVREAGDTQRQQQLITSNEGIAERNIEANAPTREEKTAKAALLSKQVDLLEQPDVEQLVSTLTTIATNKKEFEKLLGGKKQVQELAATIKEKLQGSGIDTNNVPGIVETEVSGAAERSAQLAKTLTTDFAKLKQQGAVSAVQNARLELQNLIAQGRIRDPQAAMKKLQDYQKKLGVKDSDI